MKRLIVIMASMLAVAIASAQPPAVPAGRVLEKQTINPFYVYTERGSRDNHFNPSGYMGDYGDIKMTGGSDKNPAAGKYCIRVEYTTERKQGAGWAGVYWQMPANNWGDKKGGYDLSQYKKVTFMARGEKGGEIMDKFGAGGITGQTEDGDSDQATIEGVTLTKDWKKYEIDLTGKDFSHTIGGFLWAASAELNSSAIVFYLDEIQYVK